MGKSTQCAKAAQEFDFVHISAGDLLRDKAESSASYRDFINKSMEHSVLTPPKLMVGLLEERIDVARAEGKTRLLIDGFPRNVPQAVEFEKKVKISLSYSLRMRADLLDSCSFPWDTPQFPSPVR